MSILNEIYDKDTYFKKYGASVFLFIMYIFILILIIVFCNVWKKKNDIKDDWINQRCNPKIFPFAGFINAPTNDTIISYTLQNFTECVQNQVSATTSLGLEPINIITSFLTNIYLTISECVLSIVVMFSYIRDQITKFFNSIFQILLNYLIPFQKINLTIVDILKRSVAILYTITMVFLTIYSSFKDAIGSIIQILLTSYIILIALFVVLLIFPLTIPVAITVAGISLALLSLIVLLTVFYSQIFNALPPYIPKFPGFSKKKSIFPKFSGFCFGNNTKIVLKNKKKVKIQNIKLGSILEDGSIVKAKIKLSSHNIPMYNLNGVIVSDSHYVSLTPNTTHAKNEWIQVKNHLLSKEIEYSYPYLYCLSTSSKKIIINNMYFLDWDDMTTEFYHLFKYKNKMNKLLKGYSKYKKIDYESFQQNIYQVNINDKIKNAKIIGKVKILKNKKVRYNIITNTESFYSNQIKHQDFYDLINNL